MSNISNVAENVSAYQNTADTKETDSGKKVSGRTIGDVKLSDKAAKYYDSLKSRFSNMDFILVSEDMKEQAKAQAGSYAQAGRMVVLIDEDKIERMAEDESYRKKYESLIANASVQMSQMGNSIASAGMSVKTYGMQVNDNGTATYFAVLEKSTAAQKERIEKKAQEKKAEKKAEARKEAKKAEKERLEKSDDTETVTVTASSLEELLQKIKDQSQLCMSDNVQTEAEKKVGQKFDFSV